MRKNRFLSLLTVSILLLVCFTGCTKFEYSHSTVTGKITKIDGQKITLQLGELTDASLPKQGSEPQNTPSDMTEASSADEQTGSDEQPPALPDGEQTGSDEQPPALPDGEQTGSDKQPPALPDGEQTGSGEQPPALPDGEQTGSDGQPPALPDGEQTGSDEQPPALPDGAQAGSGEQPPALPDGAQAMQTFSAGDKSITVTVDEETLQTLAVDNIVQVTFGSGQDVESITVVTIPETGPAPEGHGENRPNGNSGGNFGGSSTETNGTSAATIDSAATISDQTYTSTNADENALRIENGKAVSLNGITVSKTDGETSNTENSDFYGMNAGILVRDGSSVTITDADITTSVSGGNAVFCYGSGTTLNISDSKIRTASNNSGGIETAGGGTTNASNLDIETQGNSAAAIRSDRGGGTVNVNGGKYVTNGTGSPSVYSTADITVSNAVLTANSSEAIVVEGKNSVKLNHCVVTGAMSGTYGTGNTAENIHNVMIYQSMSGDADLGTSSFSMNGGELISNAGDMFYVTNTSCTIDLTDVSLTLSNDTLLRIAGNDGSNGWGTVGSNGGTVTMTASAQTMCGNIIVDEISELTLTLKDNSSFTGTVNPDGTAGTVSLTLENGSTWSLTGDAYLTEFDGDTSSIITNGYHVYVNGNKLV